MSTRIIIETDGGPPLVFTMDAARVNVHHGLREQVSQDGPLPQLEMVPTGQTAVEILGWVNCGDDPEAFRRFQTVDGFLHRRLSEWAR